MWKGLCDWFNSIGDEASSPSSSQAFVGKLLKLGDLDVNVDRAIAEGGFGTVYEVSESAHPENKYALKKLLAHGKGDFNIIKKEIDVLKALWKDSKNTNEHIVKFKFACCSDASTTPIEVLLLTELCIGNLHEIVISTNNLLSNHEVVQYFVQAADAVAFLHEQSPPIFHRDVKAENFLISRTDKQLRLCDFGSCTSKALDPSTMNYKEKTLAQENIASVTTPCIRSPEMVDLHSHQPINEKLDVWALGCLLHFLCHKQQPFDDASTLAIVNLKYKVPSPSPFEEYDAIIRKQLFVKDVASRISAREALELVQRSEISDQ